MANYKYQSNQDILKKHSLIRAERIRDLYLINQLNSDFFWGGSEWRRLPENEVLEMAHRFYEMKRDSDYADFTHYDLFQRVAATRISSEFIKKKYDSLAHCIYNTCEVMRDQGLTSKFDFSGNNFTLSHVAAIVSDVRDQHQYSYKDGNIDTDHEKIRQNAKTKKQTQDYGKLWLGAGITIVVGLVIGAIHPMAGIIAMGITAAILFNTVFADLDV